jgi:hypothetical protein
VGNQQWVDVLPWHGASQWALASEQSWVVGGAEAGSVKAVGPLSFVRVFEAGHMVSAGGGRGGPGAAAAAAGSLQRQAGCWVGVAVLLFDSRVSHSPC